MISLNKKYRTVDGHDVGELTLYSKEIFGGKTDQFFGQLVPRKGERATFVTWDDKGKCVVVGYSKWDLVEIEEVAIVTDDLVERLREADIYDYDTANEICNEAADHIEMLEKALSEYAKPNCRSCGAKGYLTIALPNEVDIRACYECVEIFDHVEELKEALRPFAQCAFINPSDGQWYENSPDCWDGELIAAAIALGEKKDA